MHKGIYKIAAAVFTVFITVSMLSACKMSTAGSASGGKKILLSMTDTDDTFRQLLTDAMISAASSEGVTLDVSYCGSSLEQQTSDISNAAANGYSAVIVRLVDASTALQMEVAAGDLPVIFVNNQPEDDYLMENKYVFVGSDEEEAGKLQAEWVLKKLGNPSKMNGIIMMGEKGHSGTTGRTTAVKQTIRDNGCDLNLVFIDYANWSDTYAASAMELFFKTGQSCDAIFCNNDTMALGVVEALKKEGIDPSKIPVCGVDATADGCSSIENGEMSFTAFQNADGQALSAIRAAQVISKGGKISSVEGGSEDGKYVWVPFEAVDASNVSQYK
ncbi:MAG: substrate-binding domain-containing protein [Lachnospiraceae bacterium]|nr:substrate-binding domain-containing protein [Lachnospiraceae bacterium]